MISVVFDFDGTMCRLFNNYNLAHTSLILHEKMREYGVNFSPDCDAFDVFNVIRCQISKKDVRFSAFRVADSIISVAESEAVKTCQPIRGVEKIFLQLAYDNNYAVGIATNNSSACVQTFLNDFCNGCIVPIVGRVPDMPEKMKPAPWSLLKVAEKLHTPVENIVFIGDTMNDYACSCCVGCAFIGMAYNQTKKQYMQKFLMDDMIVSDYYELVDKLSKLYKI